MKQVQDRVAQLVPERIRRLQAYHVPDASRFIKLDAMENPYDLPEEIRRELATVLSQAAINRYPDPQCANLKQSVRRLWSLPDDLHLMFGNGSDELIQIICLALAHEDTWVLAPEPSFVMYRMIAEFCGLKFEGIPLNEEFQLDADAMLQAMARHPRHIVFLAYPNNPTGTLFDRQTVQRMVEASQGLVVIDEAYYSFAQDSLMSFAQDYDNVLLMRTFSKMGMAGLRLGILLGKAAWIEELNKIRLPYNINILTQLAAQCVLDHWPAIQSQMEAIIEQRGWLLQRLRDLVDLQPVESFANFILFKLPTDRAPACFQGLKKQGILIKALGGDLADYLRVTVGTQEENRKFIQALQQLL